MESTVSTDTPGWMLVNNAWVAVFGATADLDVDTFDALFASNVCAPFFLVAAFAPVMAAICGARRRLG
jgi:NAD(P)-dependent dehydrogenase (short-subunit alcohol dehydrogenase family)